MRRLVLAGLGTVSSLVLILAYPTSHGASASVGSGAGTHPRSGTGSTGAGAAAPQGQTGSGTGAGTGAGTGSGSGGSASGSGGSASGTFTGDVADARYGPLQVQITVSAGKITAVDAVQYPDGDHHSQRINSYAVPTLNSEAVAAQSAQIDSVSGATYTSNAYIQSLQSALDAAHL